MQKVTVYVFLKENDWHVRFKGQNKNLRLPFSGDCYNFTSIVAELQRHILPPKSKIICSMSARDLVENNRHVQSIEFYGFDVFDDKL